MGKIYTIPASHGFADALVKTLLEETDPLKLAKTHIYLPTRRAVRTLHGAFRDLASGRSLILPQLTTVGDMDADELALSAQEFIGHDALNIPPAMPAAQRVFLLARLVDHAWDQVLGSNQAKSMIQVFAYARALMSLLDAIETEGLDVSVLSKAAPTDADMEGFWERAGRFIALVQDIWPGLEAQTGRISMARQRRLLLELQAAQWRETPPDHRVILAGTTASIPIVAALAEVIMGMPSGSIVLPGLDLHLDTKSWDLVMEAPSHPQYGMANLLRRLDMAPTDVDIWPGCEGALTLDRHAAMSLAQRPVGAAGVWVSAGFDLDGLALAEAPSPEQEARTIALFLREALEEEATTAALVTPDQDLAGRVKAELRRWGIEVDNSAGIPLIDSVEGRFIHLSGQCLGQDIDSLSLSGMLIHPLATWVDPMGGGASSLRPLGEALDAATRGIGRLNTPDQLAWPEHPFVAAFHTFWAAAPTVPLPLPLWIDRHLTLLDQLSANPDLLWSGSAGEGLATLFEAWKTHGSLLPPLTVQEYGQLIATQLAVESYRHVYGTHPRVSILGTLEARLLRVDALALGGLNEGTWPKETDVGPWMNRPTRALVGLPSPERKVGLAAHDLAQAFGSGRILMTRTTRIDGTPTLPSRWIERLKTLLIQTGQQGQLSAAGQAYLNWAQALDQESQMPAQPKGAHDLACPPVSARPRQFYATDIGLLVTNPYGFYAKRILRLRALAPRGPQNPEQIWGILIHTILERAINQAVKDLPGLIQLGLDQLQSLDLDPGARALWQAQLGHCLTQYWNLNQPYAGYETRIEIEGQMQLAELTLKGRADRLLHMPGQLHVIDYKTGNVASKNDQLRGVDPQLAVLGLIAEAGGFDGFAEAQVAQSFFDLPKRVQDQGREVQFGDEVRSHVREGLRVLLTAYGQADQPYLIAPFGDKVGRADLTYDEYAHLARRALS